MYFHYRVPVWGQLPKCLIHANSYLFGTLSTLAELACHGTSLNHQFMPICTSFWHLSEVGQYLFLSVWGVLAVCVIFSQVYG